MAWSQLARPGRNCWVVTAFPSDEADAGSSGGNDTKQGLVATGSADGDGRMRRAAALDTGSDHGPRWAATYHARAAYYPQRRHHAPRRSRSYFYDDACPSSGSHICIGPRGGALLHH